VGRSGFARPVQEGWGLGEARGSREVRKSSLCSERNWGRQRQTFGACSVRKVRKPKGPKGNINPDQNTLEVAAREVRACEKMRERRAKDDGRREGESAAPILKLSPFDWGEL
jgi:hypothetical protein